MGKPDSTQRDHETRRSQQKTRRPQETRRSQETANRPSYARKLDLAAHAAWLYYIADNTQEEIAAKLEVSRQAAQRLVALAVSEKLIKFRLDHPLSSCIAQAEALRDQFELLTCEVVPSGPDGSRKGLGVCGAARLEAYLSAKMPTVVVLSSGQTLRTMVEQMPAMDQPQHQVVSMVGNMTHYGRAGRHEVVMHLSERTGAAAYPVPTPVVATSVQERKLLQTQQSFLTVKSLVEQAKVTFVGVGNVGLNCPLHESGFINDDEMAELIELGAVGEVAGWAYDQQGVLLKKGTNTRVAGIPLEQPVQRLTIAIAGGQNKAEALLAALKGKLINGLITDEAAAQWLLSGS